MSVAEARKEREGMLEAAREKFRVPASTEHLSMVRDKVRGCVELAGVPEKIASQVVLASDEAVTNVIRHSFGSDGVSEVEIEVSVEGGKITLVVRDEAPPFDPTKMPDPDMEEHVKAGKKGGLGIYLMRKIMDEMKHSVLNGGVNELVLIKNLPSEGH